MSLFMILSSGVFLGFWLGFVVAMCVVIAKKSDAQAFKFLK
jgi:hypothetical protein